MMPLFQRKRAEAHQGWHSGIEKERVVICRNVLLSFLHQPAGLQQIDFPLQRAGYVATAKFQEAHRLGNRTGVCKPAVFFRNPEIELPLFERVVQRRGRPAGGKICAACSQKKEVLIEREGERFRSLRNFERIFEKIRLLAVAVRIASM